MNRQRGFTLIELLVTIAIIGVLAAIGLVALNGSRERARDSQRKNDISSLRTSLALYFDDNESQYPSVVQSQITRAGDGTALVTNGLDALLVPQYLGAFLAPPRTGGGSMDTYTYLVGGTLSPLAPNSQFRLYVQLEKPDANGADIFYITENGVTGQSTTAPACGDPTTACTTP